MGRMNNSMEYISEEKTRRQRGIYALFALFLIAKVIPFNNAVYQYLSLIVLMIILPFMAARLSQEGVAICVLFFVLGISGVLIRNDSFDAYASAGIVLVSWFCFWAVCARIRLGTHYIDKLYRLLIGLVLIAVVYNLVKNNGLLADIFLLRLNVSIIKTTFIAFFGNSNNFGFYLYVAFCLLFFLQKKKPSTIQLIAIVLVALSLLFTLSRTAIMSVVLFAAMFVLLENRNRRTVIIFSVLLVIVLFLLISPLLPQNTIINEYLLRSDGSLGERGLIWKYGWQQFMKRPILGYGFGNSDIFYIGRWNETLPWHNGYLDVLLSGGILYLILYITSLVKLGKKYATIRKYDQRSGNLYISLLISFMLYSVFENVTLYGIYPLSCVITVLLVAIPLMHFWNLSKKPLKEAL